MNLPPNPPVGLRDRLIKALRSGPTTSRADMADYLLDAIEELRDKPLAVASAESNRPLMGSIDMAKTFLSFGFDTRFDIAHDLGLLAEGDTHLNTVDLCKAYFKRAVDAGKVEELRGAIARAAARLNRHE